ncbi:MAG: hypothetical protein GC186_07010 [Rhodobacteraceae bacterium]|nr:hypothetical protein [Paracoccaceae bacterium]
MHSFRMFLAAVVVSAVALPAVAGSTDKVIYSYKDWEVRVVAWDDGTTSCVAQVTYADDSFSIWADSQNPIKLQFYYSGWNFDQSTANLVVQIDGRAPWRLNDADLYKQSVLFDLPDTRSGTQFLSEVIYGNTLYLRNDSGEDVQDYSLWGSQASISALTRCVDALN